LRTQHRKISRRISPDDDGWNTPTVYKCNACVLRVLDHVLIGQHVTVRGDNHSGAGTTASACSFARTAHVDADYRRPDVLNRADYCL
jgi:hypothetical protein